LIFSAIFLTFGRKPFLSSTIGLKEGNANITAGGDSIRVRATFSSFCTEAKKVKSYDTSPEFKIWK
jgi:hypothetical protein